MDRVLFTDGHSGDEANSFGNTVKLSSGVEWLPCE
jgi:hypothetical protein